MQEFESYEQLVTELNEQAILELVNWALRRKALEARTGRRYRAKVKMITQRIREIAAARGVEVEEFLASDELAGFEHSSEEQR